MEKISQEDLNDFEFDMLKHYYYGFKKPTYNEYEIMDLVASTFNYDYLNQSYKTLPTDIAIEKGLLSICSLNKKYFNRLKNLVFNTYEDLNENDFRAMILFNGKKGSVYQIMIPETVNEISPIWIGHECIHCLKDTNYNEYIYKDVYSEVLTMFYELLMVNSTFSDIYNSWKNVRLNTLMSDKKGYELGKSNNDSHNDLNVYNYIMYTYGQYLTSYYYALNILNLYKKYPKQVFKRVNDVLKHKMTTLDLLKQLNIHKIDTEHVKIYKLENSKL